MSHKNQEPVRVVVTGVGAVTSQGSSATALWDGVKNGQVAIRQVQHWPMDGYRTRIAGEVTETVVPEHDYERPADHRERVIDFSMKAAEEALAASGVPVDRLAPGRWGVVIGTCNAGLLSFEKWYLASMAGNSADPRLFTLSPPQALAEALSGAFDMRGPVVSIDTACAASANAIGFAGELIRNGHADAVLTGGVDALSDILIAGFNSLESLSPYPAAPYSRTRTGLSLGEGSGMVVLMREDVARELGAPILAELVGYGLSADGYHPTAPHPEGKGAARAIKAALAAAGVEPSRVSYVNSHGTGTAKNDPAETRATRLGLGAAADSVAVSSTKSMIGHLLGAAGAVEAIVTIKALQNQIAPPTANYVEADPECDLDYVPNTARPMTMNVAISNNFAFGGANATIVLARPGVQPTAPPAPNLDRVVVTGLATLSSGGCDVDSVLKAVVGGQDCAPVEDGARIGRVQLDPSPYLSARDRRRMDRLGIFAVVATRIALADAGIELTDANRERVGVVFGTGMGPMESMENFCRPLLEEGASAANPAIFPNTVYNAAGGQVAMLVGATGPASTITAGHAAGSAAICYGYDLVSCGQADAVVCLAADTLTETVIRGYRENGYLSSASDGFALAEAGVALVLERESVARKRGARVYGEVLGFGITSDAQGVGHFDPAGCGLEQSMRTALERVGSSPDAVTAIWSSATGHAAADAAEQAAIERVFGAQHPRTIAPKRLLGEPMGAGGALSAAIALQGWQQPNGELSSSPGVVVVNSTSFGGTNYSLVLAPYSQ
jgi:3-oxoacyl-[acyl-carrier-protein] synthase II